MKLIITKIEGKSNKREFLLANLNVITESMGAPSISQLPAAKYRFQDMQGELLPQTLLRVQSPILRESSLAKLPRREGRHWIVIHHGDN